MKKKKFLMFITFALLTAVFAGCKKTDHSDLEGSIWEAEANNVVFTLRFLDESTSTIEVVGKDANSTSLTNFHWRYSSEYDSMWGYFFMYNLDVENSAPYSGTIENKKLHLQIYDEGIDTLCFKKIK